LWRWGGAVNGKPVLGIVVEIQLRIKARKRFTWPLYAAALRASLECPVCVLVVTTRAKVARWAARPIDLGPSTRLCDARCARVEETRAGGRCRPSLSP
jgi:hypothetical protein